MPIRGIVMTGARGFATAPEAFRQPALDHGCGRGEQGPNQGLSLTHVLARKLVQSRSAVKSKVRGLINILQERKLIDPAENSRRQPRVLYNLACQFCAGK